MKKINLIIIAVALVLGLGQCKKKELPETPETPMPELEGDQVYISVSVNGDSKHIVYPESGAYFFENGDKLYVGNHGLYVGTLEYHDYAFSGTIEINDTCAAAYRDYLHFYFIGGAYTGTLNTPSTTNPTTSFEWSIADQTSKLPILSYGHSTQKYTNQTTAYSCVLENKCGLLKFVPWPAPTPSGAPVTISGMKTKATINFAEPGITPTTDPADIGTVTLYSVSNTEKWAILLPQDTVKNATVSYPTSDDPNFSQTVTVPAIRANCFYGGFNGIPVGLEYVDLGLSVLWAAYNVGSCTHEGFGTFFAWADTKPKTAYCWSKYKYAYNPKYYPECPGPDDPEHRDTIHFEYGDNGPNLGLKRYNTKHEWDSLGLGCIPYGDPDGELDGKTTLDPGDDAAVANMGGGWRTPTVEEWEELIEETTPTRDEVNGIGGIRFTATNGKSIFLPFAGHYKGNQHSDYYNSGTLPVGEYWSNEIDSIKPYQVWCLYFDDPYFSGGGYTTLGSVISEDSGVGNIRNEGRPVRAVHDKPMGY